MKATKRTGIRVSVLFVGLGRLVASAAVLSVLVCMSPPTAAAPARPLTSAQRRYVSLAEQGVRRTARWKNAPRHWYNAVLDDRRPFPLAPVWDVFPLWESVSELALAAPSSAHRAAVIRFADYAETYWDPNLKPGPGFIPYPSSAPSAARAGTKAYFDDNGWWGLAFLDAYRAVRQRRYLRDAEKAFGFITRFGWDKHGGGIWWNNRHPWRSGEALAAASGLSARLYRLTGQHFYLRWAVKLITWANHHVLKWDGSYALKVPHEATMSHAGEGSMLSALTALCETGASVPSAVYAGIAANSFGPNRTSDRLPYAPGSWCSWAEALATKTDLGVPSRQYRRVDAVVPLNDNPQTDAVYVRGLLDLYQHDHNHLWYDTATDSATRILDNARGRRGLFLRGWNGARKIRDSKPGMLRTHAASVSVFAALALIPPSGT
ncbi:MAG TPA: glycoside hydrolase family 76 protein [Solirubrobacteraceae bacterium]